MGPIVSLCPHCGKIVGRNEDRCSFCGLSRRAAFWRGLLKRSVSWIPDDPVLALIGVNSVLFALSLLLNPQRLGFGLNPLTFLSPSDDSLFALGATGTFPIIGYGRWWTLFTASFLHGGILHLFFNMAALKQLGPFVTDAFGVHRFLIIYILSGAVGFFFSLVAGIPFTIGASASICGLIGAILYYGKSRGGRYGQAIFRQSTGWVIGLILFGLIVPGINNWAHGGGLLTGLFLGWMLGYEERVRDKPLHRLAALCLTVLTILCFVWAGLQALTANPH